MPSSSTDFLYSLLAMSVAGVILTFAFASYVNLLVRVSEVNQLREVLNRVAAKATEALVVVTESDATLIVVFQLPLKVGDRDYWIRFANDSSAAWIEGSFGNASRILEQDIRIYMPKKVYASGTFEGGYEIAQLNCSSSGSTVQIILSRRE